MRVRGHAACLRRAARTGQAVPREDYHREIAFRIPDARCEVAVDVRFGDFCKTYYLDLLVGGGAIFELKAVEALAERHRRQLVHYLFLADLPHGKLVNLRRGRVEHEFVNNVLTRAERTAFTAIGDSWYNDAQIGTIPAK